MGCGASTATQVTYATALLKHNPDDVEETWLAVCETLDVPKGEKNPNSGLVVKRSGWKTVRIFVSSTFKDFQHEREVLVKQVFLDLRAWCEKRRLHLLDCDLRWGIPQDSTTELTLRTCLGEIDRCYADNVMPYFLNMTSERIGWIPSPQDVPQSLVEEYRWIFGLSVTEMEIIHGAYRKDNPNSLFLIRKNDFLESIPPAYRTMFVDEHRLAPAKLKMLRSMIEDRFPVFDFFKERISQQYPLEDTKVNPYQHIKESHESFMKQRCDHVLGRKLILDEMDKYISEAGNGVPLLLLGNAGAGKSSIMAKAVDTTITQALELKIPGGGKTGWHVFYHFVGAVPGSTELESALKRLLLELGVVNESTLPTDLDETSQLCCSVLANMNIRPVIVFMDALNQLKEDAKVLSMTWVPRKLAPHVRCIFSMIQNTAQHVTLANRDPENKPRLLKVPPLDLSARKDIVTEVLGRYQKRLTQDQMTDMLNNNSSANPLWLSIACEELRVFGDFHKISAKVASLKDGLLDFSEANLKKVYMSVEQAAWGRAERFEVENGGHMLVATLCLLETSSCGLLESELITILSEEDNLMPPNATAEKGQTEESEKEGRRFICKQLPAFKWAQVYRALRTFLRPYGDSGEGRLDFYHRSLSKAVRRKYFKLAHDGSETEETHRLKQWWHKMLANYFEHTDKLDRKVEEYPHHLLALKDVKRMTNFLLDQFVIDKLYDEEFSSTLLLYWRKGGGGTERLTKLYMEQVMDMANTGDVDKDQLTRKLEQTGNILHHAGAYEDAKELTQVALKIEEEELGNRPERMVELTALMCHCVDGHLKTYDFIVRSMLPKVKECVEWARKSIGLCEGLDGNRNKFKLAKMMVYMAFNMSSISIIGGDAELSVTTAQRQGIQLVEGAIKIFTELNDHGNIAEAIMTKAILSRSGSSEQLTLYQESMDVCQQVYGEYSVLAGRLYVNTGIYYEDIENYSKAYEYFRNNYRVHRQVYGENHPKSVRARAILYEPRYKSIADTRGDVLPDTNEA